MSPLSVFIFMGIPLAAALVGLVFAAASIMRWNRSDPPAGHYIASRMAFEPEDAEDGKWLDELDSLKLPYRHTVC